MVTALIAVATHPVVWFFVLFIAFFAWYGWTHGPVPAEAMSSVVIANLIAEGHTDGLRCFAMSGFDEDSLMVLDPIAYDTLAGSGLLPTSVMTQSTILSQLG
jgi:hypothetical protein